MKVNLKKIGSVVAGAAIFASSVAFAGGLWFENTQLINENGAPLGKIAVGANGAITDGVAAALMAAKWGSEAYAMQTVTAKLAGEATCVDGGMAGDECTITDKSVRLEVTVPGGAVAGTYTVGNLIGDFLNRDLEDRNANLQDYPPGSDTSENSNPFTNGTGGYLASAPDEMELYRVTGSMFTPLATQQLHDDDADRSYDEQQDMWLQGDTAWDDTSDDIVGDVTLWAYSMKFSGSSDDLGIPVCTGDVVGSDYTDCDNGQRTDAHKLNAYFLGEPWVISDMEAPTPWFGPGCQSESELFNGGSIKLAKESVSGIVNQGEALTADGISFVLADIVETTHEAAVDVTDAAGNVLTKEKIPEGETLDVNVEGKTYRIHVYKTTPGYTYGAKWADMAIFSHEFKLEDNEEFDPDEDGNDEYQVSLGWKDKGADNLNCQPDHLRTVILYTTDSEELLDDPLEKGDYVPMLQDPANWKLSYLGLSITNDDRDNLKFHLERTRDRKLSKVRVTDSADEQECEVLAQYVKVTSGKSGAFEVQNACDSGTCSGSSDVFYVATRGAVCSGGLRNLTPGTVLMPESSSASGTGDMHVALEYLAPLTIDYSLAGDGESNWLGGGVIIVANGSDAFGTTNPGALDNTFYGAVNLTTAPTEMSFVFAVSEKAGTGSSHDFWDAFLFPLNAKNGSDASFDFNSGNWWEEDEARYIYAGPVEEENASQEEGYISERGSVFEEKDDTAVEFKIARELAHAQLYLSSSESGVTESGTLLWTMKEGEDKTTSNDVNIKVAEIMCEGTCAVGTAAEPTCDTSGMSAQLYVDDELVGADTVDAAIPYGYDKFGTLVILDNEAVDSDVLVSVGGPVVNTVTAGLLEDAGETLSAENPKIVKEVVAGKKIVVAGYEAEDTLEAASDFIAQLKRTQ